MNLSKLETYKVIESDNHISIVAANAHVLGSKELVRADIRALCIYLERYMWERAVGTTAEKAHEQAVQAARFRGIKVG